MVTNTTKEHRYPPWVQVRLFVETQPWRPFLLRKVIVPLRKLLLRTQLIKYFFYDPMHNQSAYILLVPKKVSMIPYVIDKLNSILHSNRWKKCVQTKELGPFCARTTTTLGGNRAASIIAEFNHWGSLACLKFEKLYTNTSLATRFLFATLCTSKVLDSFELTTYQSARLLSNWVNHAATEHKINKNRIDRLANQMYRSLHKNLLTYVKKDSLSSQNMPPSYSRIIQDFAQNILIPGKKISPLREAKHRVQPLWEILGRRIIHPHWLRLGINLSYELVLEKTLSKIRKSGEVL